MHSHSLPVSQLSLFALLLAPALATAQSPTPIFAGVDNSPYFVTSSYIRTGVPILFTGRALPADATGTITFYLDGVQVQTSSVATQTVGDYIAVGDSITSAGYIGDPSQRYQSIVGAALNLNVATYASPGYTACDTLLYNIMPNGVGTTTSGNPLYSLWVGNNELLQYGVGPNEALFNLCDQAALSWLGLARNSKILIGDPGVAIRSGTWTSASAYGSAFNALTNSTGSGAVRFSMTTYGGAAYLWYLLQAGTPGSFAVSVDGGPLGPSTSTLFPSTTQDNIGGAYALLRIPLAAGAHTFDITAQSGTVSVFAMGTPPAAGTSVPTVLAADVQSNQVASLQAGIAEYTLDTKANIALLHSDGLDLRFVPTQQYMFGTPAEMMDTRHPNALGLSEIAQAFLSVVTPTAPASGALNVAAASYTLPSMPVGAHVLSMAYSGDSKYPATSAGIGVVAFDPTSSVALSTASISPIQTAITLTATIPNQNADGLVTFFDTTGGTPVSLGSAWADTSPGVATLTLPGLIAGTHTLMAQYAGDIYNAPSSSPAVSIVISNSYTTTALSSPATRYFGGATESFTATVAPASATGTVTFLDGTTVLAQLPVTNGSATFTTTTLAEGLHSITASYSGNGTENSSTSPALAIEIDGNPTTVAIAPLPATSPYATPLALQATVSPATATGTVAFEDGATFLGNPALVNGVAALSTTTLGIGTHTITATYSGDSLNLPAVSSPVSTQITVDTTSTTLAPIPAAITFGTPVTLAASVTPAAATGNITFTDSVSGPLATVAIVNGTAGYTTSTLAPGTHTLSASYSGDSFRAASASAALLTTVNPVAASIALAAPPATIDIGNPLTLTASISPPSATGTVLFRDATLGVLGQATIAHGTATLTLPSLALGTYSITATYSGDTDDSAATSAGVTTQIILAPTTLALASSAPTAVVTTPVTLTATLSSTSATGSVTFFDGASAIGSAQLAHGSASLNPSTLAVGAHSLHAVYSGDSLNAAATSATLAETITLASTATSLTLAQSSVVAGSPVLFNVRVNSSAPIPTGAVTIRSGATTLASGTLANGSGASASATLSINSTTLGLGTFPLVAYYAGDADDQSSDSSATPVSVTVAGIPTSATLTLSAAQIPVQGSAVFNVAVASATGTPTGSVAFLSSGVAIGTAPLNAQGAASFTLNSAAMGTYAISAAFTPTGLFAGATAASQTLTVTPPLTAAFSTASISASPGTTSTATLTLTPLSGFSGSIQTLCQSTASFITCTVNSPATISGVTNLVVEVAISKTAATLSLPGKPATLIALALLLPLLGLRRTRRRVALALTLGCALCVGGCAVGDLETIPAGPQTVSVTVTAAGVANTQHLTVTLVQ